MRPARLSIIGMFAVAAMALVPGVAAQASTASTASTASNGPAASTIVIPATTHSTVRRIELPGGGTAYARSGLRLAPDPATKNLPAGISRAAADNTYATGYAIICNNVNCSSWENQVDYAVTWNGTDVWINGYPKCYKNGTSITWCGYGDNGQKTIGIGDDFGTSGQWTFRIYVYGSDGSCDTSTNLGTIVEDECA